MEKESGKILRARKPICQLCNSTFYVQLQLTTAVKLFCDHTFSCTLGEYLFTTLPGHKTDVYSYIYQTSQDT